MAPKRSSYIERITEQPMLNNNHNGTIPKPAVTQPQLYIMDKTAYNIAKAKFFGVEPEDTLSLKQDVKFFYGHNTGSPAKIIAKPQNGYASLQENVSTNVIKRRRSQVGIAGDTILRSSSTSRLDENEREEPEYTPVIGRITHRRTKNQNQK